MVITCKHLDIQNIYITKTSTILIGSMFPTSDLQHKKNENSLGRRINRGKNIERLILFSKRKFCLL